METNPMPERQNGPTIPLTRAAERPAAGFDLEAFLAPTTEQPLHTGTDAAALLLELREGARY
jgi:hypothetical protein